MLNMRLGESMIEIYGIANCDTVKKARKWLTEHGVDYVFHDYKKEGVNAQLLQQWIDEQGWEVLLNKRGTTWRKLSDADKQNLDASRAKELLLAYPSMIKRPVLLAHGRLLIGFSETAYAEMFA